MIDADVLIAEVIERMDADEIVEVLDMDMEDLVEELRNVILDRADRFVQHLEL